VGGYRTHESFHRTAPSHNRAAGNGSPVKHGEDVTPLRVKDRWHIHLVTRIRLFHLQNPVPAKVV